MILPDLNLLFYAYDSSSALHEPARDWLEGVMAGSETVGLAWLVLVGFVRLSTRPALVERPLSSDEALDIVDCWLARFCTTVVHPGDRHSRLLRELLQPFGTAGNLTNDAHLAALSIEHGATLYSRDVDFARFSGVRWVDPLS